MVCAARIRSPSVGNSVFWSVWSCAVAKLLKFVFGSYLMEPDVPFSFVILSGHSVFVAIDKILS